MENIYDLIDRLCPDGVEFVKLGNCCTFKRGTTITAKKAIAGDVPVIAGGKKPSYYHNEANRTGETIAIASSGTAGYVSYWNIPVFLSDSFSIEPDDRLVVKYVYYFLKNIQQDIYSKKQGGVIPHIYSSSIADFEIPIPPIEIQTEIVRILDKFTSLKMELEAKLEEELRLRKKQYEYYRDKLLTFDGDGQEVEWREMNEVLLSIKTGLNPRKFFKLNTSDAHNYYVTIKEMQDGQIIYNNDTDKINDEALRLCNNRSNLEAGDLLFSGTGTIGKVVVIDKKPIDWNIKEGIYALKPKKDIILSKFLAYVLNETSMKETYMKKAFGGIVKSVPMKVLGSLKIPIPPLAEQQRIVTILDKFEKLTTSLQCGIPAEIKMRKKQYEYYRNKLLTFKRKEG